MDEYTKNLAADKTVHSSFYKDAAVKKAYSLFLPIHSGVRSPADRFKQRPMSRISSASGKSRRPSSHGSSVRSLHLAHPRDDDPDVSFSQPTSPAAVALVFLRETATFRPSPTGSLKCRLTSSLKIRITWSRCVYLGIGGNYAGISDTFPDIKIGDEGFFNWAGRPEYIWNGGAGIDWDANLQLKNIDYGERIILHPHTHAWSNRLFSGTFHLYPEHWGITNEVATQYITDVSNRTGLEASHHQLLTRVA